MNHYVGDAHALFWYLTASPRLGSAAAAAFAEADAGAARIHIPAIVLAEIFFVNEKLKRPVDYHDAYNRLSAAPQFVLHAFWPVDVSDFDADAAVPEMHDRMIVGLARRLGCPCITKDQSISNSGRVAVVW
jgi:PIN domain nuclease of toxin-antitoxin system